MKTFLAVGFAAIALLATAPGAGAAEQLVVGKRGPAFSIESLDGRQIVLSKLAGRPVFINVFATWCPPCKLELPHIVKLYPRYAKKAFFLGIDEQESPEQVKAFAKTMRMRWLLGIDPGHVGAAYGVAALPESVFIDAKGIVRAIWRGSMSPSIFQRNLALIGVR